MNRTPNYVAPRALNFEDRLKDFAARAERRFEARMLADTAELQISIMDVIGSPMIEGSITAKMVEKALKDNPGAKRINLRINSPGGICSEGVAIYNLLASHPAPVHVEVLGEAASAASLIAMAGDKILMRPGTWMMVHEAVAICMGPAVDMRKAAEYLETVTASAVDIYARRTKRPAKEVAGLLAAETWMTAADAIEKGFADGMAEGVGSEPVPTGDGSSLRAAGPAAVMLGSSFFNPPHAGVPTPTQGQQSMQLTHMELEVCRQTGTPPKAFLERKQFEAINPTTPQAVNRSEQFSALDHVARSALSAEELRVCEITGTSPVQFLERKAFEAANPHTPFSVNVNARGAAL